MNRYQRPNIAAMHGYTSGEQPQNGNTIKLNTNENPYPASPAVQQALQKIDLERLRTYPQPTADALRDAIAAYHGLARENVVVTNGGDEALRLAMTTYVEPGKGFGMATPSYSLYPVLANVHDARIVEVPLEENWQLPGNFSAKLNHADVQLTCIVNPHAPSGTMTTSERVSQLAEELEGVLLIDEAYANFIDPEVSYQSAALLDTHKNLLILRTFSKGYSLAGLRLGYLLGDSSLIDPIISKTRDSYNVDHISQVLGLAAFDDTQYAEQTWAKVRQDRTRLMHDLSQLGLQAPPSQANFLLAELASDAAMNASQLYSDLKGQGILVRYFEDARLENKLRITVGTPEQNQRLLEAITSALT